MNGIHVLEINKDTTMEAIEALIGDLLGVNPDEEARTMPLKDKSQQNMRDVLFKQGDEINEKVHFLKRLLQLTSDLITLINEDHVKEDGSSFIENRMKQAAVTKRMIQVMEEMKKTDPQQPEKANGAAGS